jgi:hypothetical protein
VVTTEALGILLREFRCLRGDGAAEEPERETEGAQDAKHGISRS